MNRILFQFFIIFALLLFLNIQTGNAQQQATEKLSLSIGSSLGYAPTLTFGETDDSGAIVGLSGDSQFQRIIGQFDFVYILSETLTYCPLFCCKSRVNSHLSVDVVSLPIVDCNAFTDDRGVFVEQLKIKY